MTDIVQIQESVYDAILRQAVAVIDRTRAMVATTVCSAIGTAHWEIGKLLHDRKIESKHGSGVVNRLSFDLKQRYPQMGVSPRNLWDMKKFYERFCGSDSKLRQAVAVLPWGHTLTLMRKFGNDDNTILYYAQEITSKGWNRELLSSAISLQMHKRKNEPSDNNFEQTLPATQAMFANEVFRSGYNLGFLGVKDPILETELEARLVEKVKQFLLELGRGFSFVARQKRITFDGRHFRIDLVFYNYILKCFVLIDLKVGDLTHQDLGQMQMYVHYYERELMNEGDNSPIGIVLCADKSESVVKYTLPENETQIFASKYKLYLPSEEELLRELNQEYQALEAGKTGKENSGDMKEE